MNQNKCRLIIACLITSFILAIIVLFHAVNYFISTHFLYGTIIENVNYSFWSIDEVIESLNQKVGNEPVCFCFGENNQYVTKSETLGIRLDEAHIARIFEEQHRLNSVENRYYLDGHILVDDQAIREYFATIPELKTENMIKPQNAYIVWDGESFSVESEVYGNYIDFNQAITLTRNVIEERKTLVDFCEIMYVEPNVYAKYLIGECNRLNSVLNTTINYVLADGKTIIFDSDVIKYWVSTDAEGNYIIDVVGCVEYFIGYLYYMVDEANSYIQFSPSNFDGTIKLDVPEQFVAHLNIESECQRIYSLIGSVEPNIIAPIYDGIPFTERLGNLVELDIARQHVWFYKNNTLVVNTDCVTGNVYQQNDTPTGIFNLLNKNLDVILKGSNNDGSKYETPVKFWMRFYEGCGFHDATWRSSFGGSIYKSNGSHGCVNLPYSAAEVMYENFDNDTVIIIYNSQA